MDELVGMLRRVVTDQLKIKADRKYQGVKDGIFCGGCVYIDGILYPCEATNENFYADGENVKCLLSNDRYRAVIL